MHPRATALLATVLLVGGVGLSACSDTTADGGADHAGHEGSSESTAVVAEALPQDVVEILADYGVEASDARAAITGLDRVDQARPLEGVQASVRTDEVVFATASGEVSVPIPGDEVYVSVAPFVAQTHDCFYHALGGCQGELVGQDVHVQITDAAGEVLVDEEATTYANGFVGFWLPADVTGTITITDAESGRTGEVPFDTGPDGPTCITTLQLA